MDPIIRDILDAEARGGAAQETTTTVQAPAERAGDPIISDILAGERASRNANVESARLTDPNAVANIRKLARDTGFAEDSILGQEKEISAGYLTRLDKSILDKSPAVSRILADDPWMARSMADSVKNAADIEATFRKSGFGAAARKSRKEADRLDGIVQYSDARPRGAIQESRGPEATAGSIAYGLAQALPTGLETTRQGLRLFAADLLGLTDRTEDAGLKFKRAQNARLLSTPEFDSIISRSVYAGAESTLRMLPGYFAAALTRSPNVLLGTMGAETSAEAYGRYRVRGASPEEAFPAAVGEGAVEVITEALPMRAFLTFFKGGTLGAFGRATLQEQLGEQSAALFQDAIDTAVANPNKTWGEYLRERPEVALQTAIATATQMGITAAVRHAAVTALGDLAVDTGSAETSAADLAELFRHASENALRGRDPETFAQFFQQVTDGATVFVSPQALLQTLTDAGVSSSVLPSFEAQRAEADLVGTDVEIPVSEIVTALAGTGAETTLIPNLRMSEDSRTLNEVRAIGERAVEFFQTEAERIIGQQAQDSIFQADVQLVRDDFRERIGDVSPFGKMANQGYADLLGSFYTTVASNLGILPSQFRDGWTDVKGVAHPGYNPEFTSAAAEAFEEGLSQYPSARIDPPGRSNWKIFKGEVVTLEGTDDYYYHVTSYSAAKQIIRTGLIPNVARMFSGTYRAYSRNKVFLTERDGVNFWKSRVEDQLFDAYDKPPAVAVVRIPKSKVTAEIQPDTLGTTDARANAYFVENAVVFQGAQPSARPAVFDENIPAEEGYVYHTTDEYPLYDIADSGKLKLFGPSYGTEQDTWPDGSRKKRAYFGLSPKAVSPFQKGDNGKPVLLRTKRTETIKEERGTSDLYSEKTIPADQFEYFGEDGAWHSVAELSETLAQGPLGSFNPQTLTISLLAEANLSTFLHETGHFFLTVYADLASQPDAPPAIVRDMNALLEWFGVADLVTWNDMALDQQRPFHEQAAESFEQYLFTGKAPTAELQPLFRRMAAWFTRIYRTLKRFESTHTGAKLNPEVSAVFDRMLATDAQIAQAQEARGYTALFTSFADAGMTVDQFAAYLALAPETQAEAEELLRTRGLRDMKWLQNRRNKVIAELQEEAQERRKEVRQGVEKELAGEPVYRAMRWLKRGELTDSEGNEVKALAGHKLSIPALKEMFPADALAEQPKWAKLGYGKYGMLAEEGLHPDMVADVFGFSSGESLIHDLLAAEKFTDAVEGLTDQRMLEQYGDLIDSAAIAQAADEAIANDTHIRMLATELSHLTKTIGSPAELIKAAKEFARQIVAAKTSKTLKPGVFAAEATRAGKRAMEAMRKGDRPGAAAAKRSELLNNAAAKEAYAAVREMEKLFLRLKKLASGTKAMDEKLAKARDMDMVQAIRAILAEFGIGRHGEKAIAYLGIVEKLDPGMSDALDAVITEASMNAKPYNDLTLAELRQLGGLVESVWFLAKRTKQVELAGQKLSMDQVRAELVAKLRETPPPSREAGESYGLTKMDIRKQQFAKNVAKLKRPESWVGMKDGADRFGPWRRYVWMAINDADTKYVAAKEVRFKQLRSLLQPILSDMKPRTIDASDIGYVFGRGDTLGYSELLHALLHTGNPSNKRKLLLGRGWATEREDKTLDTSKWDAFLDKAYKAGTITKAQWDFVQSVWDFMEELKPDAQRAYKQAYGRYFEEITAEPVKTPFGEYRGGYVPALTDPLLQSDADLRALQAAGQESMLDTFPTPRSGFAKSRVDYNSKLELNLQSLTRHVDSVLLMTHMLNPVRDVQRILKGGELSAALTTADREAINYVILPWLKHASTQTVVDTSGHGFDSLRVWSTLRSRTGMAFLFGNVVNTLQQVTGFITAIAKVKPTYLVHSTVKGLANPRALARHVTALSPYMDQRLHNQMQMLSDDIYDILLAPSGFEKAQEWAQSHAYFLQIAMDSTMSPMIWLAKYNEVMESGKALTDLAEVANLEKQAIELADSIVRTTQGSQRPIDVSAMEAGSPFYRMFTQFAGFFNTQINLIGEEVVISKQLPTVRARAGRLAMISFLAWYAPAVVSELIVQAFRGGPDSDDDYLLDWLVQVGLVGPAKYALAFVPFAGTGVNALFNALNDKPYDDRISLAPAISAIESGVRVVGVVGRLTADDDYTPKPSRAIRDVSTLVTLLVGIPTTPAAKSGGYLADIAAGRVEPTSQLDFIRGTISGVASAESKQ